MLRGTERDVKFSLAIFKAWKRDGRTSLKTLGPKLRGRLQHSLLGRLLPLPSNPTLSLPAAEPGGGHCVPMRHFVTRERINVNVAAARLLARPDVHARPLPSPTASSQLLPPRPAMPPSASNGRPRGRRASSPPEVSPATPRLRGTTCAAQGDGKAGEKPQGSLRSPLPSPSRRPSQRRAREGRPSPPGLPTPTEPGPPCRPLPSNPPLSP